MDPADPFKQKIPKILLLTDEDRPISPLLPMDVVKEDFNNLIPEILMFTDNERPISPIDPDSTESPTNKLSSMNSSDLLIDRTEKKIEKTHNEDKNDLIKLLPSNLNFVGSSYSSKDKQHSFVHIGNDRFTCHINTENVFAFSLEKPKVNVSKEEACSINSDQISKQDKAKVFQEIENINSVSIDDSLEKELSLNLNKSVYLQIPLAQSINTENVFAFSLEKPKVNVSEEACSINSDQISKQDKSKVFQEIENINSVSIDDSLEKELSLNLNKSVHLQSPIAQSNNTVISDDKSSLIINREFKVENSYSEKCIDSRNNEPVGYTEEKKTIPVNNKAENVCLKFLESKRKKTISGLKEEESAIKDKNSNIEPVSYTKEKEIIPGRNKTDNIHSKSLESKSKKTISGSEEESAVKDKNNSSSESCIVSIDIEPVGYTEEKKNISVKNKNICMKSSESERKKTISVLEEESAIKDKNSNIEPVRYTEENKVIPVRNKTDNIHLKSLESKGKKTISGSEKESSVKDKNNSSSESCIGSIDIEPVGYTEEKKNISVNNKNICMKSSESKRQKTISVLEGESAIKDKNSNIEPVRYIEEKKVIPVRNKTHNICLKSPESKIKKTISGSDEESTVKDKNISLSGSCIGSIDVEPVGYTEEKKTIPVKSKGNVCLKFLENKRKKTISVLEEESAIKDKNSNIEVVGYTEENKVIPVRNKTHNIHLKSPVSKRKKTISGSEEESSVKDKNNSSSESCIVSIDIEPLGYTEEKKNISVKNKNICMKYSVSKRQKTISVLEEESAIKDKNSNIEPVRYIEEKKVSPVRNKTHNICLRSPVSKRKKTISGSEEESAVKDKNNSSSESCIGSIDIEPVGYTEEKKNIPVKNKENICMKSPESKRQKTNSGSEEPANTEKYNPSPENRFDNNTEPVRCTEENKTISIKNQAEIIHLKSSESRKKKTCSASEEQSMIFVHPIISVLEEIKKFKKNENLMKINDLFKAVSTALQDPHSSSRTKVLTVIYNYICSSKLNPVVSFLIKNKCSVFIIPYEKALVETLIKIEHEKETRIEGLLKLTMLSLKNLILEKRHIQKTGSAAFCRIYTLICKSKKMNAVLKLTCDLIKSNHQFAVFLIANIIGTWKEIFIIEQNSKDSEVQLLSAIAYGVQKRLCKNNSSETKILKTVFSKLLVAPATENPSKAVQICIENLKNIFDERPTENNFFFLEPIIIFSSIEGDKWAWENVVKPFLLPCLMGFANRVENKRAFSILLECYAEIGLCVPEVSVGAMNALLKFFNMKDAYAYVKPMSAIFLTKLCLSKKATLFPELLEWIKKNETNLQGTIVESTLKRLLISDEPYITINDICDC